MARIAILGAGAMASRMTMRLLEAGHSAVVHNRTPASVRPLEDRGALRADSPRVAARDADLVISVVTDDAASRAVWLDSELGAIHGLGSEAVAIESSTLTPAWVRELGATIEGRGRAFLDAPVVGSRPQAEAGQLVYLVGGSASVVEKVTPVLSVMGRMIHRVGPMGSGTSLKLAVNALFGTQVVAVAEMLAFLRHAGVDLSRAIEILGETPVMSPVAKAVAGLIQARSFAPMFPIELVEKDLRYVVQAATQVGSTAPAVESIRQVYARAVEAGYGGDNIAGVAQLYDGN